MINSTFNLISSVFEKFILSANEILRENFWNSRPKNHFRLSSSIKDSKDVLKLLPVRPIPRRGPYKLRKVPWKGFWKYLQYNFSNNIYRFGFIYIVCRLKILLHTLHLFEFEKVISENPFLNLIFPSFHFWIHWLAGGSKHRFYIYSWPIWCFIHWTISRYTSAPYYFLNCFKWFFQMFLQCRKKFRPQIEEQMNDSIIIYDSYSLRFLWVGIFFDLFFRLGSFKLLLQQLNPCGAFVRENWFFFVFLQCRLQKIVFSVSFMGFHAVSSFAMIFSSKKFFL